MTQHPRVKAADQLADSVPPHLTHDDPLLACLVALTRMHGRPHTGQALIAGLPIDAGNRLTLALLPRAAARAQLSARLVRRSLEGMPTGLLPALLVLKGERACLLLEIKPDSYVIQYSESPSAVEVSKGELESQYDGFTYFIRPVFRFEQRVKEKTAERTGHWFWDVALSNWRLYRDALVAAVLINIFALALPLFTMNVYDRVVPNNAVDTLWVLALGIALVLVFNMVLTSVRAYVVDTASKRVDVTLSAQIMERVLDLRMESRPVSVGSFAANLRSFESVRDFIASASLTTLVDLPFVLLFLAVLAWISPWMLIPPVVAIVVVLVVSYFSQARMDKLIRQQFQASAQRNATLVESLAALETVKALNAQGIAQRQWEASTQFLARLGSRIKTISSVTVNFVQMAQQLVTVSVIIVGAYLIQDAQLSLGGIIAASMIAGRCLAPLGQVAGLMMQFQNARTSLESVDNYMKMPVERPAEKAFLPRPFLKGDIELRGVEFTYPNSSQASLSGINLKIRQGEKVGIIGRIGSGKSTLEKIILGLYAPTAGTVLVDGIDIQQIDPADLRRAIGYVPQDPVLFYGTLRHNLAMGAPFADARQVMAVAETAGIDGLADGHPEGYDMLIGERGDSLSGGQRQSVAIARALINNPPILLLDEPSSNMDNQSEVALKTRLRDIAVDKTLILVTHRTSLLDIVDRLVVVDKGTIVADGPKEQVVEALRQGRIGQARRTA
ncbi:MAG TPA: type I secretion system permease/ATPase [Pusillimonas sp.]|uniref:type I secretion system permease/ATPase n=1 Tax=Pusillimonas sp. TaxID=3040095 RepID=UPI002C0F5DDC|nr:type I secretion system permease/ATPase [Pusillimonas sp.]HUH88861.1 type I secretion system permease/ATPase [Pusillimonas sp.]